MRAIAACCLASLFLVTAGLSAEDKKEEKVDLKKLLGKWEPGEKKKDADIVIEFLKEGKLTITAKGEGKELKIDGTYKLNGNKLDLALSFNGQEQKETLTIHKLTDEELSTEDSKGKKETLKRIKGK